MLHARHAHYAPTELGKVCSLVVSGLAEIIKANPDHTLDQHSTGHRAALIGLGGGSCTTGGGKTMDLRRRLGGSGR